MSSLTTAIQEALDNGDLDLAQNLIEQAKAKKSANSDHIHIMEPKEKKYGSKLKFKKTKSTEFFDDPSLFDEDRKFDKAYPAMRARSNRPPAPKLIKATCRICGRIEKVNPIFVTKTIGDEEILTYRCNKCCGGG